MRAAPYLGSGRIALEERERPAITDAEMLVAVRATSICGTDLRILAGGHFRIVEGVPRVLGHELAGEIVELGRLVQGWSVGQRVSFTPNIGCGRCEYCRQGYNNMCPDYEAFGISLDGGFQEFMRVPAEAIRGGNVFAVPDAISDEAAALIEPLSCCYNAWSKLRVTPEDTVLVIGPGPIGAFFVQLAKLWGARSVIAVGRREERLRELEQFAPDHLVNSAERDLAQEVMAITEGRGVDVVILAASDPDLQPLAVQLLARHGRVNFFGGLKKGSVVALDTNRIHYHGLTVTGTTGSSNEDYFRAMRLVENSQIDVTSVISHRFPLSDIGEAFSFAQTRRGMKSVVLPA